MKGILLVLVIILVGCNSQDSLEEAQKKVKEQNEKLHQVVATKNVDLLKEVYAEDANFMPPRYEIVKGRDSIIAIWKNGIDYILDMNSKTLYSGGTVDVIYEIGIVETTIKAGEGDSTFIVKNKYSNVWVRDEEGVYRLTVDIWNPLE
ncbi:MAG: nuclear transport factor 2 family protein [Ignavibacteriales bacterium]|nr:nuclear transport factor 2 family protein [Ignavibacteriales bacterium]